MRVNRYIEMPEMVEQAVVEQLRRYLLLQGVRHLGVAVSGGADSVALLYLMLPLCRKAGVAMTALHLNHGLRVEAVEEERYVRELCARAGIHCHTGKADLSTLPCGLSLEMAARRERMRFLRDGAELFALDAIATGHHADDVAESMLLRLMRGSGATGLSGLRPRSEHSGLTLIRPLLAISSPALRAWLRERNIAWREDGSNLDTTIQRNCVRHTLLPFLEKHTSPGLRSRLCMAGEILREEDVLLEELAGQALKGMSKGEGPSAELHVAALRRLPAAMQRRILRQWLFASGEPQLCDSRNVLRILDQCAHQERWKEDFSGKTTLVLHSGWLKCRHPAPMREPPQPLVLDWRNSAVACWGDFKITVSHGRGVHTLSHGVGTLPARCSLAVEQLQGKTLQIRGRHPGDRIRATGMSGAQKIKKLFNNARLTAAERDQWPLLVSDNQVVWVPGHRIDRAYSVPHPEADSIVINITRI